MCRSSADIGVEAKSSTEQLQHMLSYYALKIEAGSQGIEDSPTVESLTAEQRKLLQKCND